MLSKQQFAQNKFMRYIAYAIVFGFALMMFLPGSFSFIDVFRGKGPSSGAITVDGVDISQKEIPYYGVLYASTPPSIVMHRLNINQDSLFSVIKGLVKTKQQQQDVLLSLKNWEQWRDTSGNLRGMSNNPLDRVHSRLLDVILWQMNIQLAKDLNYGLSKDKFNEFIDQSYQLFLDDQYKGAKRKADTKKIKMQSKEDFIINMSRRMSDYYYRWADKELKERYLHSLVAETLIDGVLPVEADIEQEYLLDNHKVQVDYALYTYDKHFIKESIFKKKVKEKVEDLKKYYRENEEKIDIKRVQFSSEEKAGKAKNDPELFMEEPKDKTKKKAKYQVERRTYYADNDMFKKLRIHKKGNVTDPIKDSTNDKIFYIYKIMDRSKSFDQLKENSKEYISLIKSYAKDHYIDFKEDYEKRAQKVLKAFIDKAVGVKDFRTIKRGERPLNLKVGRTDFFTQTNFEIKELSKTKEKAVPESIKEFESNNQFMKTSYALKPGELSHGVLSEEIGDDDSPIIPLDESKKSSNKKKVFFVVKKVAEKIAKINVLKPKDKKRQVEGIIRSIKRTDFTLLNSLWLPYLQKKMGYKVKFNY
ncbi:MAG: hypothetical protein IEMM0008_1065 [bacterium]|nr:MAG: hypothetical protein IEMM0008_1065 [bacterium]